MVEHHVKLEQFMTYLQHLNRYLRTSAFDKAENPVTRVQWLLMRQLQRKGEQTIGQLALKLDVRASTMSQMLDRLEKSNFVLREPDPLDARVKLIRLTDDGVRLMEQIDKAWLESMAEPFDHLRDEEKQQLLDLMEKFNAHLPRRG